MAGRRRSARQRAALRKAQLASARKRRRGKWGKRSKAALGVVGTIAGAAALHHVNYYAQNPRKAISDYKSAKNYVDRKRGKAPALTPGLKSRPRKRISYVAGQKSQMASIKRRSRVR